MSVSSVDLLPPEARARLLSPALVISLDAARSNIARIVEIVGGAERWRPHVKTSKIPAIFSALLQAGVRHYKCATLREAERASGSSFPERASPLRLRLPESPVTGGSGDRTRGR